MPAFHFELLTFNSQLSKLGIAPHHPIGYNDGRFDGIAALIRDCGGKQKASATWTLAPTGAMKRASAPC